MYQIENPIGKAMNGMNNAAGTYGGMMKNIPKPEKPDPTVGGAMMAGAGGAAMGAQAGTMMGASLAVPAAASATGEAVAATTALGMGPIGWAGLGIALGIEAYLSS